MKLPTKPGKVLLDFLGYTLFVFGPPKIGKSSLFKHNKYFYLGFEKGLKALGVFKRYMKDWETFLGYLELLEEDCSRYNGVVVDTAEKMYDSCLKYTCEKYGMEHPSDEEYGKGWERVKTEFTRAIVRLENLPLNKAYVSHSHVSTISSTKKKDRTRISPKLSGTARHALLSQVDMIIYIGYSQADGVTRRIYMQGSELIEAGGRLNEVFRFPRSIKYRQNKGGENFGLRDIQASMKQRTPIDSALFGKITSSEIKEGDEEE